MFDGQILEHIKIINERVIENQVDQRSCKLSGLIITLHIDQNQLLDMNDPESFEGGNDVVRFVAKYTAGNHETGISTTKIDSGRVRPTASSFRNIVYVAEFISRPMLRQAFVCCAVSLPQ